MKSVKQVLAFDFGASSGRAMRGSFDGEKLRLEEVHRFSNDPVVLGGTLYWDTLRHFYEIQQGIGKCWRSGGADSIGIDTWGCDFGLLDAKGRLLESQVHYRDARTAGMIGRAAETVSKAEVYDTTGIQFMECNTLYQLLGLKKERPELLENARTLLFTPDLFNYFLTGEKQTEYTIASTSQLLSAQGRTWADGLMEKFGIPRRLFTEIVMPGRICGTLSGEICRSLDVAPVPVIHVASHDTGSAVVSVPADGDNFAYLSSGTWSLLGTETAAPVVTAASAAANFTNEGGYGGRIRLLKNIGGLWLIQESRRQWQREGTEVSFADLEQEAKGAPAFRCFIDPDAPDFVVPGDIPGRIREMCARTGQTVPQSRAEVMRCIYESLALKYRYCFRKLEQISGHRFDVLHVIGGGTKDRLLSRFTADACGREVITGPVEATVLGNIAVQLIALGELSSLSQARRVISASFELAHFEPQDAAAWEEAGGRFESLFGMA